MFPRFRSPPPFPSTARRPVVLDAPRRTALVPALAELRCATHTSFRCFFRLFRIASPGTLPRLWLLLGGVFTSAAMAAEEEEEEEMLLFTRTLREGGGGRKSSKEGLPGMSHS